MTTFAWKRPPANKRKQTWSLIRVSLRSYWNLNKSITRVTLKFNQSISWFSLESQSSHSNCCLTEFLLEWHWGHATSEAYCTGVSLEHHWNITIVWSAVQYYITARKGDANTLLWAWPTASEQFQSPLWHHSRKITLFQAKMASYG